MSNHFFEMLIKYNIKLIGSKYPQIEWNKIEKKLKTFNIALAFHGFQGGGRQILAHHKFDLTGSQHIKRNFLACHRGNRCITLKHGKLYTCTMPAHIHHFNKFFDKNLEVVSDRDCIDIYENGITISDILYRLTMPIPFCRYCDLSNYEDGIYTDNKPFTITKREISKWL
jgi:hypothetical protein